VQLLYAIDHLGSGGAQRQAVQLAVHLRTEVGIRVRFLIYRDTDFFGERLRDAGIPVICPPKRFRYDPRFPHRIRRWLEGDPADVLHAFLPQPVLWSYLAVRGLRRDRRPVFISAERSSQIATTLWESVTQRLVYRGSDAVTVNAERAGREIAEKLGVPPGRIHYIPNAIDLEDWDREAGAQSPIRLAPGCFHLALVGGLRSEKNHRMLLEALGRLGVERIRAWRVWFIGDETGDPALAETIRSEIAGRELGEIVRIVPPTPRIAPVIRRMHGVLLPSRFEGFPNVALEAMASRVPVIASAVGDVPNMLDDGRTGIILGRLDATHLADALAALHALSPEERAEMGRRARGAVEERYTMPVVAARYLALYRAMLEAQRARSEGGGR
jgi:glycosyltransferase involved in cell wall biosynthesis